MMSSMQIMRKLTLEQREARRALYAEVLRLREEMNVVALSAQLGIHPSVVYQLMSHPPMTEAERDALLEVERLKREVDRRISAQWRAERLAERKELKRQWREAAEQREREESHEINANAFVCLIEAFIELRPYVGTE